VRTSPRVQGKTKIRLCKVDACHYLQLAVGDCRERLVDREISLLQGIGNHGIQVTRAENRSNIRRDIHATRSFLRDRFCEEKTVARGDGWFCQISSARLIRFVQTRGKYYLNRLIDTSTWYSRSGTAKARLTSDDILCCRSLVICSCAAWKFFWWRWCACNIILH
jgi:hypothetical protein